MGGAGVGVRGWGCGVWEGEGWGVPLSYVL